METRTVRVSNLSALAEEREIHEFFSFSGEIEHLEIFRDVGETKAAFVTFKEPRALEIALELSGATIIDQIVRITPVENYVPRTEDRSPALEPSPATPTSPSSNAHVYVSKAQDVVTNMLAKGSAMRQDAVNKAKAFDEKHRLTANASAKVIAFDRRVGLTEKLNVGISVVNEKVKSVDQRLHVSDKTMAALLVAEKKLNDTGTTVKSSRYVTIGASWLNGAFSKVTKAGQVASMKTREKFQLAVTNLTAKESVISA
ncbi:unnamed protein product [Victoria cruziana]